MNGWKIWAAYAGLIATFIASTGYMTGALNGRMNSIDRRIDSLETSLNGRMNRLEAKIDNLDAKFDQLLIALAG